MLTQILYCIVEQHDLRLVAMAGVICWLTTYTAFSLAMRTVTTSALGQHIWIIAAAVALGCGVWTTHFIAMLGFRPHQNIGYQFWPTFVSVLLAIFISGIGLWLSMRRTLPSLLAGGALIGAGIGAMHYTGMIALQPHGILHYDATLVGLSLAAGITLGAVAIIIAFTRCHQRGLLLASALLALGICGLHFIGMAALQMTALDATVLSTESTVPAALLAIAIAAVTLVVLVLGLGGAIADQYFSHRATREAQNLRASEARFRQLANATFEGIVVYDNGIIQDANNTFCALTGTTLDRLIGTSGLNLVEARFHSHIERYLRSGSEDVIEVEMIGSHGECIPVEIQVRVNRDLAASIHVVAVRDLRERKQALDHIHHLAHHDVLTGLANRKLFLDRLDDSINLSKRSGAIVAVLCLDLDRFKNVNDLLGHWGGDELLRIASKRLSTLLRAQDTVARLGGDEFAIVQVGATPEGSAALAERLLRSMAEPFQLGDQQVLISTSIGIALFPGDGVGGSALLRAADTALYRAKEDGRNGFRFFEAAMDVRLQERALLEHDLRAALANDQLEVHYQPLVDCHNGTINGYEALLRWRHPLRGAISPADFIPLAEECGLILSLGHWVLRTACAAAMSWPAPLKVAVNLSPAQFRHGDLAGEILEVLRATGLPAPRLEIEITEGVLITDTDATLRILSRLKAAGVRIALDDFGTGYSSLSYLQRFPFDKIKIDRSFIWQMEQNHESMSIVRAVIALGHSLQIMVTAEGVETSEQLALLQNEQCDQVQGYLLGRPAALPTHTLRGGDSIDRETAGGSVIG